MSTAAAAPTADTFPDFWGDPIHVYTRAQALADGELVDVSEMAREFGFRVPVAVSRSVWADISEIPSDRPWESVRGRLGDLLGLLAMLCRRGKDNDTGRMDFKMLLSVGEGLPPDPSDWMPYPLRALSGPGDAGEHVLTVCLPGEE